MRLVHIVAGSLWVGIAIFYLFFVKPSVKAIGPAGPKFMQNLAERRKYPIYMLASSLLTVLAGGVLYFFGYGWPTLAWLKTGPGIGLTIGSLAALVAFLVGTFGIGPTSARMGALGHKLAQAGGLPDPAILSELQALEVKLNRAEIVDFVGLSIAVLTMATARYWPF